MRRHLRLQNNFILGAGSNSGSDTDIDDGGIVRGHAYSILKVTEVRTARKLHYSTPYLLYTDAYSWMVTS